MKLRLNQDEYIQLEIQEIDAAHGMQHHLAERCAAEARRIAPVRSPNAEFVTPSA